MWFTNTVGKFNKKYFVSGFFSLSLYKFYSINLLTFLGLLLLKSNLNDIYIVCFYFICKIIKMFLIYSIWDILKLFERFNSKDYEEMDENTLRKMLKDAIENNDNELEIYP